MRYEYGVVTRRRRRGEPAVRQLGNGDGCREERASLLAVMNRAGERG